MEEEKNNNDNVSIVVVSNDNLSKQIKISKTTKLEDFYNQITSEFPDSMQHKFYYYEAYSQEIFLITNEEEYVIANKKGIEYFYFCANDVDYNNMNDKTKMINYLKYYSVIIFSPIKLLNSESQNNQRKKMQMTAINDKEQDTEKKNSEEEKEKNILFFIFSSS